MNYKKTLVVALSALFISFGSFAQKDNQQQMEKEANALFKAGDYLKAYPLYSQLLALYPGDAEYNYKFGACAIYSDPDKTKAVKFLTIATSKALDDPMAWYYLGKAYHLNYQFKDAIKSYEKFMAKADPKIVAKTDAQRAVETCIYGSNLLANIRDIDVVNKTEADKENFFRYFNLEEVGGKILTVPGELKSALDKKNKETGVMHYTGNGTTIYFSSYGKDGSTGKDIYRARVLPDGKFTTPEKVKGGVNTKYDEDYCFMHSDGKTLYFSSKGHNSMGGYDIFKSEYNPETDSFGPAVNLDFAINTPDDDIFYITDSLNQQAYFASGRTSDMNHLSVYNVLVQSTPLQVVYLKGDFFNEVNNEQKSASFKIVDSANNRLVCEGSTMPTDGSYVLYVPRSGKYTFKVTVEGSPAVHEEFVEIPLFDRPVALHQEMRLISENGRDKITFRNHFEQALDEDLSSLAASMLRKKAGLEINVAPEVVANITATPAANAHALEPIMQNAPLAAGFPDGVTVGSVIQSMESDLAALKNFQAESDQKYTSGYAYALKKQKEAEMALTTAETLRRSTSTYATEADIAKLREAHNYTTQAENLQREALAAMNAADATIRYKDIEAQRAEQLEEKIRTLKQAEATDNFDAAVAALKEEKQRKNSESEVGGGSLFSDLVAKSKSKEQQMQSAEKSLTDMRARERSLESSVKISQDKINSTTKKSEKQAAENQYITEKAELDKLRREIAEQNKLIKKLGSEMQLAHANVEVYKRLANDTGMGLTDSEKQTLSDNDKNALTMRLNQMSNRISALEITDAKMLAMITDDSMNPSTRVAASTAPASGAVTLTASNPTVADKSATVTTQTVTATEVPAASLKSNKQQAIERTGKDAAQTSTRKMYLAGTLEQTNDQIAELEQKKQSGKFTTADNKELNELMSLKMELQQELTNERTVPVVLSPQEFNTAIAAYVQGYTNEMNVISARSTSEVERVAAKQVYNDDVISRLKEARVTNAMQAMETEDSNAIAEYTRKDKQLESMIAQLEAENTGVSQLANAYDKDMKQAGSASAQAQLAQKYISTLTAIETQKEKELELTSDLNEANDIRMQIGEVKVEKSRASATLEETSTLAAISPATEEAEQSAFEKAQEDAKTAVRIFKPRVEAESIFSYESGIFEELATKHQSPENTLLHRDKIRELNNSIFLIEGEMENEKNERKLRKLDYQAEQMYLKRSLIEIENSPVIARMAAIEFETESAKAKEMTQENREKIDSRIMLRDEIARLEKASAANMEEAIEMRAKSPSFSDDIERADYDRQAFAKEALAIEQIHQIQQINENIDMLVSYTDENLAQLTTGTVPAEFIEVEMPVASVTVEETEQAETTLPTANATQETTSTSVAAITQNEKTSETTVQQPVAKVEVKAEENTASTPVENTTTASHVAVQTTTSVAATTSTPSASVAQATTSVIATTSTPVAKTTTLEDELESMEEAIASAATAKGTESADFDKVQSDAKIISDLFKPRVELESIFAYESGIFEEIVQKRESSENQLLHRDKIRDLNNQIFTIEAEMENVTSDSKLRKLDYQAEQVYLKRSLIEIENSPSISRMTDLEYSDEAERAKAMTQANREKIDSRVMIKVEVENLEKMAKQNQQEAEELRSLSPSIIDDIERADNDRKAFAKEALAIEQMRQLSLINENIDLLLSYSDEELALLKTGTVPAKYKEVKQITTPDGIHNIADNTDVKSTEDVAVTTPQVSQTNTEVVNVQVTTTQPATVSTQNGEVKSTTVTTTQQAPVASYTESDISTTGKATVSNTTIAPTTKTATTTTTPAASATSTTISGPVAVNHTATSTAAIADANYYFSAPAQLTSDIFRRTTQAAYSRNQPIPIDMEMPQGIYYKVQVGAFRNPIPQNLYDEFAPVCGERLANGITRYTAGFFMNFNSADDVKREIRSIGYSDAFVVAFRDGKRIPLYEAIGTTEGAGMMAAIEKEYIYGDKGEAPKSKIDTAPKAAQPSATDNKQKSSKQNGSSNSASGNNNGSIIYTVGNKPAGAVSDYYTGFPDAAKATKVEMTQGLFYTVQVGVYSRPIPAKSLHYINPLNSELTESKKIRYTSGMFTSMEDAVEKRTEARTIGISDAFITAYYNGQRISLSEADKLLKEKGPGVLVTKGIN